MKFREKIAQFMYGRRGADEFARFVLVVAMVLIVLSWLFRGVIQHVFSLLTIASLV